MIKQRQNPKNQNSEKQAREEETENNICSILPTRETSEEKKFSQPDFSF